MIEYLVGYDSINIFRIWISSKKKIIKTKNVAFDHTKFYDSAEVDLSHFLAQPIESIVEVLKIPEMPPPSNDIVKEDEIDEIEPAIEDSNQSTNIPLISEKTSENLSKNQAFAVMSTPEATPKRGINSGDSVSLNQKRHNSQIPADAIAMNTKFRTRRQAYATILGTIFDFIPYYSAFAVGLKKSENSKSTLRLHRDFLPVEPRH